MIMKIHWFLKCLLGFGNVSDGSICWFSHYFWDLHDFYKHQGGDGYPSHFHEYKCYKCGKKFTI